MDQPDAFQFEYDIDEAVSLFLAQQPGSNASCMEDDPGDRQPMAQHTSGPNHEVLTQMPNASVGRQVESPILPTEFPSALQLPFHQDQPFLGPSWKEEAHPINPTQSLAIGQHVKLSGNTACAPSNLDPSANFQFVSGAVVKEDRSGASGQKRSLDAKSGFKCDYPGCKYRGSFTRKFELQRHSLKHTERTKYPCPIQLCAESFYRTDKLRLHLRRSHKDDDQASCPVSECGTHGLPWILLRVHMRNHRSYKMVKEEIISIGNFNTDERGCPVQSCQQKHVTAQSMSQHLQSHDFQERTENKRSILEAGYDPLSAKIICPVCQTQWVTHEDFKNHAESVHIVTDLAHLREFRNSYKWSGDVFWRYEECPFTEAWLRKCCDSLTDPKHYLNFLHDPEDLRPYRITLLKLLPELGVHPVFDDIVPKEDRSFWRHA